MVNNTFNALINSPFILHSMNKEGTLVNVSDGWLDLMGYNREEVIGKNIGDFLTTNSKSHAEKDVLPKLFDKGKSKNNYFQAIKKDNTIIDILVSSIIYDIDNEKITLCFITDITDQKKNEKNLERIKQSLANAQRIAHLGNWDWDIIDDEIYWSDEAYMVYYGSRLEKPLTYDVFIDTVHPEDRTYVDSEVQRALQNESTFNIIHRVLLPDNTIRVVKANGEVLFNKEKIPYRMIGTVQDITKRYNTEVELDKYRKQLENLVEERTTKFNETLEMYKTLARISPVAIMRISVLGECEFVNKKWCDITGLTKKESMGSGWMKALHPDDEKYIKVIWKNIIKNKQNWTLSFKLQDINNNTIWVQCSGNIVNGGSVGYVVTFTNMTREQKILPELLVLQERIKLETCETKNRRGKKDGN